MLLKKGMMLVVVVAFLASLFGAVPVVWAEDEPSAEDIILDVGVLRPAGLITLAAGTIIFVVSSPLALITKSTKTTAKKLVVEPYEFTFGRP